MSSDSATTTPTRGALLILKTLRSVLRPLARLLLAHSIPFQQAAGVLKQVYVDVALEEFARSGSRPSTSRLSVFTGIHRKEIKRLCDNPMGEDEVPRAVSLCTQLVARWTTDAPFADSRGRPLPLSRNVAELGVASFSFDDLVMSVSTDVHPRAVLDEWLRLGIVRIDRHKRIHLVTAAFVPRKGFEEKLFYFDRNLHDHLDVAVRNLAADEPPLLERSVHYSELSQAAVEELGELALREGMKLLEKVNRRARALP